MITRRQFFEAAVPESSRSTSSEKADSEKTGGAKQDEFISLFDGESLDGWHSTGVTQNGTGGRWRVENGVITGQQDPPGSGNGGILMTDEEYGDFELLVDLAPDWGIDSGVFLRAGNRGYFQVYVDYHDHGNIGSLSVEPSTGEGRVFIRPYNIFAEKDAQGRLTGFTAKPDEREVAWDPSYLEYSAPSEEWMAAWEIGGWNTLRIRCVGKYPRITTWINYTKIAEFDGATCPHPRYDREERSRMLGREAAIALQVHSGTGAWKKGAKCRWDNIRIKPL